MAFWLYPDQYDQRIITEIERRWGPYTYTPRIKLTPNLYKRLGAYGQTTFISTEDGRPVLIEIDKDIYLNNPALGIEVLTHELLEWCAVERGEEFPHYFAEKHTPEVLKVAMATPLSVFLERRPLLRFLLRGR